jgi:hypothetical protein
MKLKQALKALLLKAIDRILVNDLYMAYHGDDLFFTLWDLDQYLRTITKYNPDNLSDEQVDVADKARDKLYALMEEHGVDWNHVE